MHDGEIDVAHVVGRFVVLDEAAGPVISLHDEIISRLHPCDDRDVGMPAVVDRLVLVRGLRKVDFYQCLCHYHLLFSSCGPSRGFSWGACFGTSWGVPACLRRAR